MAGEARGGSPGGGAGKGFAGVGFRLAEVAAPDQRLGAEHLYRGEREHRSAPVCLGEQLLVDRQHLVAVGHREHRAGRKQRHGDVAADDEHALGERAAREGDGVRSGSASRARVEVGEEREQQLVADGLVGVAAAHAFEPLARRLVPRRREEVVRDQSDLEQVGELGVGAGEFLQRRDEHGIVLAAEEEELTPEHQRRLRPADRVVIELVRRLQVLDCGLAIEGRLGRAELEQQVGAIVRCRWLRQRAA